MKRFISLFLCGIIALVLIPILAVAVEEESDFDVVAGAADDYLNDADTVFNISSFDLLSNILSGEPYIISIRSSADYATGHIPGAVNMSAAALFEEENLAKLPKDKKIVVYCYTGHTGSQTAALLNLCDYDATNLTWGIMGWTKDTSVATKQFSNPTTDLPTETTINEPTITYDLPTIGNTSSIDESEITRIACENYASAGFKNIKASDLYELITDTDAANDPVILSVRSPEDYAKGHIPGAINISFKDIARTKNLQKLNPDKQIVVYCYTGRSGSQATAILNALGYDATNLLWGISGWTTDPVVAPKRFSPDTSVDYPTAAGATPPASDPQVAADDYLNATDTVFNISSEALLSNMLSSQPYILSIREHEDFVIGHIPGAVNMSAATLFEEGNLAELPTSKRIYVYCYTGHTASQTAALLNLCGYDATNITWGIMGWTKDTSVATKQFSNPTTDLPTETTINEPTTTYSVPPIESGMTPTACYNYVSAGFKNIKASDLYELITDTDPANDPLIVSVRSPEDYAKGHIPGAINITLKDIAKVENLQKLDPDKQIVVYCYTGRSGSQATAILNVLGYDATNLLWGISGWTTDSVVAPKRFNPDTSVDYPLETGEARGEPAAPEEPTPEPPPANGGGPCG